MGLMMVSFLGTCDGLCLLICLERVALYCCLEFGDVADW